MIKLPEKAITKFTNNYLDIFHSGNLAEGKWNNRVSEWAKNYASAAYALPVSSNGAGLYAILNILKRYRNYKKIDINDTFPEFIQSNKNDLKDWII